MQHLNSCLHPQSWGRTESWLINSRNFSSLHAPHWTTTVFLTCLLTTWMTTRENPVFLMTQGKQKRCELWREEEQVFFFFLGTHSFPSQFLHSHSAFPTTYTACSPKAALCNCSSTLLHQDQLWSAAFSTSYLIHNWSQTCCDNQWVKKGDAVPNPLTGEGCTVINYFDNIDLSRFHSSQCHPLLSGCSCRRQMSLIEYLSVNRVQQKQSLCFQRLQI